MIVVFWLLVFSLILGGAGLATFLWTIRSKQYEDLEGAAQRVLFEE